jgi:hypothetical protein
VRERLAVSVLRDFERFCDHRHTERDRERDRETECERGREMKSMAVGKAAMSQGLEMSRALNCSRERDNGGLLGGVGGLRQCKTDRVRLTGLAPPSLHTQKSKLGAPSGPLRPSVLLSVCVCACVRVYVSLSTHLFVNSQKLFAKSAQFRRLSALHSVVLLRVPDFLESTRIS